MPLSLRPFMPIPGGWRLLLARLPHLGSWWIGQIQAMLPPGMQHWLKMRPGELQLRFHEGSVEVTAMADPDVGEAAEFPLDQARRSSSPLHEFLRRKVSERTRVALVVPRERLLVRTISLPAVARENLRQVLVYEMDRHTPFTAEQVYYDYCILAEAADQIQVRLFVSTRDAIDGVRLLVEQLGLRLHAVRVAGDARRFPGVDALNLLPTEMRAPRFSRRQWINAALKGFILLQIAVLLAIPFWHQERRMSLLDTALSQARVSAEEAFAVRDRRDDILASLDRMFEQRRATPSILQTLDELSARLPDNTWLQRIEIKDTGIHLQGESSFASALIRILEDSPLLMEVGFRSPVTQDPRSGQENFQIAARLGEDGTP